MTLPVIVTRLGKGSELTFAELDANFTNLRDGFNTVYSGISGDITVTSGGVASLSAGVISNADINAAAAIAYSKLAPLPAGQVILGSAGEVPTATSISGDISLDSSGNAAIAAGAIVDADINTGAQIAHSKLANLASGQLLIGSAGSVPTATALSGDVTVNSSGVTAITAGSIVNADINASAAIAFSKMEAMTTGQVLIGGAGSVATPVTLTGDVTVNSSGVTAISSGSIVNADISGSAAIGFSKLQSLGSGQILVGDAGSVPTAVTMSGDVTIANTGSTTISAGAVTNSKVAAGAAIALNKLASMTPGTVLIGNASSVPTATTLSGAITVNSSGVTTLTATGITDDKLATISTAGKVANSATTATADNTASAIVARDGSGDIAVSSINGGPIGGCRNALINGNFDIWTRGTDFVSPSYKGYLADRWRSLVNGSGSFEFTQETLSPGTTIIPQDTTHYMRFRQITTGSGQTISGFSQPIEDVRTYANQEVTISFYVKANTSLSLGSVRVVQEFGSGGSTAVTTQAESNIAVTTSWQKYVKTFTVPTINGKTIGTGSHLDFQIRFPTGQTQIIDIARIQLEPGSEDTPFELRPFAAEKALCQRYYYGPLYPRSYIGTATGSANIYINFPAEMRTVPSVSYVIGVGSGFGFTGTTQGMNIVATVGGGGPDNYRIGLDDLYFDAEIT